MEEPIVESHDAEVVESSPTVEGNTEPTQESAQTEVAEATGVTEIEGDIVTTPEPEETIPKSRFNEVYWKMKENERKLQEYEARLNQNQQNTQQSNTEVGTKSTSEPRIEEYDYDQDAYTQAMIDYNVNKKFDEYKQSMQQQEQQSKQQEALNTFRSKAAQYAAQNPDYITANNNSLYAQISPHVEEAVVTSDVGPELHHYLLTNPDVLDKLNSTSPLAAARELGRIETGLISKPKTIKQTSAPAPIETVTPNVSTSNPLYDENMDMEAFYAEVMKNR